MDNSARYPNLKTTDAQVYDLIEKQCQLESTTLKMIPSESFAPYPVLEVNGSTLTNKYCEGYPHARYYEGNEIMDEIEDLATERAKEVFGAEHANVQPYSGSPANQAAYRALANPGDKIMGMPVPEGGHLTHGWGVNFSGTDYVQIPYGVDVETGRLDFAEIRSTALRERPKIIWVGGTSYPRIFEYDKFAEIAREIDAYLVADIAHINALIIGGVHPNPVPHCDVVTSTTHKILRGPRGGFILSREEDRYQEKYHKDSKFNLARRIDRAVFPHLQGGPHMQTIAAIAVAFKRAMTPEFRDYAAQVVKNCRKLADELMVRGRKLVSGGTDNHLLIMDFRENKYSGKRIAKALSKAGIICNFNMVPGDQRKPFITSGVRMGTPAVTSMGMKEAEMEVIAGMIDSACQNRKDDDALEKIRKQVAEFCSGFPVPGLRDRET